MSEDLKAEVTGYRSDVDEQVHRIKALLAELRETATALSDVSAGSDDDRLEGARRNLAQGEQLLVDFVAGSSVAVDLLGAWAERT